jgi:hypothetical protein
VLVRILVRFVAEVGAATCVIHCSRFYYSAFHRNSGSALIFGLLVSAGHVMPVRLGDALACVIN